MQRQLFVAEREQQYFETMAKARAATRAKAGTTAEGNDGGILPYQAEADEEGDCTAGRAGLPSLLEAARGYGGDRLVEEYLSLKQREPGYTETEFVESICLLQASAASTSMTWRCCGRTQV